VKDLLLRSFGGLSLLLGVTLRAQQPGPATGVIAGRVIDAGTGEARVGTTISIVGMPRGTIAGPDGRYVIPALTAASYTVRARLLGYRVIERAVTVRDNDTTRVDFALEPEATVLGAVKTEARPIARDAFEQRPSVGTVQITSRAAEGVPRFGEADIIRVVQLLPGVEARNDFSTGLNVRGGESDQNLILIDGFPIYNPFHLGGLFSTFIDPTVGDVTLLTGGFPARYGGRLSAVLDVHSAEEVRPGLHGTAEVSLLASTGAFNGALNGGKGSWMIAARRTYADKFISAISTNELPYHFRDEQAHFSYAFTPTLKFAVTAYDGRDALDADIATFGDSTTGATASGGAFQFGWGNTVVGASLTKTLGRSLFGDSTTIEQRVSNSRFATTLDLGQGALLLNNRVGEFRAAGSVTGKTASHERSFGYDLATYGITYEATSEATDSKLYDLRQNPTSGAVYFDDVWRVSPKLILENGVRVEALTGRKWTGFSPRLSAKYFLNQDFALTGAIGRFSQWTHSLAREDIPVRLFDFWLSSDESLPVSSAWHYVLGAERWLSKTRYVRVEGFYKRYANLLEGNPQEDPNRRGDEFTRADGDSYGADFLLRQFESGPLSGWISYTYAVAARTSDGLHYFPGHDRRHNVNVVASWRLKKYLIGARYGYATGTPYTDIVGQIVRRVYDPGLNAYGTRGSGTQTEFIGGPRNGARLPSTQRLDFDITRKYRVRGTTIAPYLSIVNAYNAKNVFLYVFDYAKAPPTRQAISQFPFLPSAGLTIEF
jgi:hypothetical protein